MDYHKLREIEREELQTSELVDVPDEFYGYIKSLEDEISKKAKEKPMEYYREYEAIIRSIQKIKMKRIEKIVFLASKGQEPKNLVSIEKDLFFKISAAMAEFNGALSKIKAIEEESVRLNGKIIVRIIKDVDQYIGGDGKTVYGPFKDKQNVEIDEKEGRWLIENGFGVKKK